tara:strand:- start:19 stop:993 length:975 start_codon:yes stop_codon:yes gene_type:complete
MIIPKHKLRLAFAGTPLFAAKQLKSLIEASHNIVGVYTQPDRPAGRGKKIQPSAVKILAQKHKLNVYQPESLRTSNACRELALLNADVLIVAAYGLILPKLFLEIPSFGCINIHASLLPRWRGAAPIERALLAGDTETGVTLMQMDEGLDTGQMLCKTVIPIENTDTRESLEEKIAMAGALALIELLSDLPTAQLKAKEQNHALATYAKKIEKSEASIDWFCDAKDIELQIRAGFGRAPAFSYFKNNRIRIIQATKIQKSNQNTNALPGEITATAKNCFSVHCGSGELSVTMVQLPGKTPQTIESIKNARPDIFQVGDRMSNSD